MAQGAQGACVLLGEAGQLQAPDRVLRERPSERAAPRVVEPEGELSCPSEVASSSVVGILLGPRSQAACGRAFIGDYYFSDLLRERCGIASIPVRCSVSLLLVAAFPSPVPNEPEVDDAPGNPP